MESSSVEIGLAGIEHEQGIIPLMAAFNNAEAILWKPDIMIPALRRLLRERDLGSILVAQDPASGVIVGYGVATFGYDLEFAGTDAIITELFVEPSYRGRGLGRELLDSIVKEVQRSGANAVHLMVRPENARARSLYQNRGFREVPRLNMTKLLVPSEE